MPDHAPKHLSEARASDLATDGQEAYSRSKAVYRRSYRNFIWDAVFAALILLIVSFMLPGALFDKLPRRNLKHCPRIQGDF
jgi:hypothetical protein